MAKEDANRFEFGKRPSAIKPTPRDSKHGTVTDEVGVFEYDNEVNYWKVIQRVRKENGTIVNRYGYYEGKGDNWRWHLGPLMLNPTQLNQLNVNAKKRVLSQNS